MSKFEEYLSEAKPVVPPVKGNKKKAYALVTKIGNLLYDLEKNSPLPEKRAKSISDKILKQVALLGGEDTSDF